MNWADDPNRCCCGRIESWTEIIIINNITHERLGDEGAFCGTIVDHELRDAGRLLRKAEEDIEASLIAGKLEKEKLTESLVACQSDLFDCRESLHKAKEEIVLGNKLNDDLDEMNAALFDRCAKAESSLRDTRDRMAGLEEEIKRSHNLHCGYCDNDQGYGEGCLTEKALSKSSGKDWRQSVRAEALEEAAVLVSCGSNRNCCPGCLFAVALRKRAAFVAQETGDER